MKRKIPVHNRSKIVGKTIREVEEEFDISIVGLDNLSDRAFVFSWETMPSKTTTIKSKDEIVVFGEPQNIQQFSELAACLN